MAFLNAIWDSWRTPGGFSRTFSTLFGPYFQSYPENFSLFWAISSIQLMFSKWRHFERHLEFLGKLQGDSGTFSMLCPYFQSYTEHVTLLWAISSIRHVFVKMTAILDAILDILESSKGIVQKFSMLFCWFCWTYSENFSLFWANSSIQVMFFDNNVYFGCHLEFPGSSRRIVQNF